MSKDESDEIYGPDEDSKFDRLRKLRHDHPFEFEASPNVDQKRWSKLNLIKANFRNWQNLKRKSSQRVKLITTISILLALLLFSTNITNSFINTNQKIAQSSTQIAQKMLQILATLKNKQNLQNSIQEAQALINTLDQELKPLDSKLWPIVDTRSLVSESWSLAQNWIESTQDLVQFKIGSDGLSSNLPKNFTEYLQIFFDRLPDLLRQTEQFLQKIKNLISWVFWLPNAQVEKIRQLLGLSDDIIDLIRQIYQNRLAILDFLGYQNIHKILIFNQNLGESRPTGGFIGSYLSINITQGRFDIGKGESIYKVEEDQSKTLMTFPVNWYYDLQYGRYQPHGIKNLNYFSCFPDSASLIESEFSQAKKGQSADTVIFLTPNLIKNLFDSKTELKVDLGDLSGSTNNKSKNQITLTQANFYDQIEKLTAIEIQDISNPKSAIGTILLSLVLNIDKILANQDLIERGLEWLKSGYTRDIQIWSKNINLENLWELINFAGTQTCQKNNQVGISCKLLWVTVTQLDCGQSNHQTATLAFLQANLSADKRDIFAIHDFNINLTPESGGNFEVVLKYSRNYKNLNLLQRKYNSGNGVTFLAFQLPKDATEYSLESEQSYKTPFIRPFYSLNIKDQGKKELYTPAAIEKVIQSSNDLNGTSFTYQQSDQSLVIGTYVNEEDTTELTLRYKTRQSNFVFYPVPAFSNNNISVGQNGNLIDLIEPSSNINRLLNSNGEGVIIDF